MAVGDDKFVIYLYEELAVALIHQIIVTGPGFPMGNAPDHGVQSAGQEISPPLNFIQLMDQGKLMDVLGLRETVQHRYIMLAASPTIKLQAVQINGFLNRSKIGLLAIVEQGVDAYI